MSVLRSLRSTNRTPRAHLRDRRGAARARRVEGVVRPLASLGHRHPSAPWRHEMDRVNVNHEWGTLREASSASRSSRFPRRCPRRSTATHPRRASRSSRRTSARRWTRPIRRSTRGSPSRWTRSSRSSDHVRPLVRLIDSGTEVATAPIASPEPEADDGSWGPGPFLSSRVGWTTCRRVAQRRTRGDRDTLRRGPPVRRRLPVLVSPVGQGELAVNDHTAPR